MTGGLGIRLAGAVIGAATALLFACSDGGRKLVVYAAGPEPLSEHACRTFTAQTGVPVELFSATTGQIMAKLEAEKYRPRADVVLLAGRTGAEALKDAGSLLAYRPKNVAATRPAWNDPDGFYHGTSAAVVGIAVRRELFTPDLEWTDILDGRFRGRSVMPSPSRSGSSSEYLLAVYQEDPGGFWRTFLEARRDGLEINGANNQALTSLLIGSHQAVLAAADYLVYPAVADAEPVVMHFPASGCPFIQRPIAILAKSERVELARQFVDHYFSEDVQRAVSAAYLLPALATVPLDPLRAAAGEPKPMPFDVAEALRDQGPVLRRFQYQIERALIEPREVAAR